MTPIEITYNTPMPIEITLLGVGTKGDKGIQGIPGATYDDTLIVTQLSDMVAQNAFNAKKYGAKGDNTIDDYVTISLALTDIGSTQAQLYFPRGQYKISTDITFPSNIEVVLPYGSSLVPDTGVVITINGLINAGEYKIFDGLGFIEGVFKNKQTFVKWFNIDDTLATDASIGLQKVVNICQNSKSEMVFSSNMAYKINNPLTINYGKNSDAEQTKSIIIHGNNSKIYPNIDGFALLINPLCSKENSANGWGISYIDIHDLPFDNYFGNLSGYTNSKAIKVGKIGYTMDGFQRSKIENILCLNFPESPFEFTNVRFLDLERIMTRGGPGLKFTTFESDGFCGDINIRNSDFVSPSGDKVLELYGYVASGAYGAIRGLHFDNCVFYGSDTSIVANTHVQIGDVWFDNCAWDVGVNAISMLATGDSQLFNIYFDTPYVSSYSGFGIKAQTSGSATAKNIKVNGGNVDVTGTESNIVILEVEEFSINNVTLSGGSGDSSIGCSGSQKVFITGCIARDTAKTNFVTIGDSSNFMITNNVTTKPINDYSGAVNKLVANNLIVT